MRFLTAAILIFVSTSHAGSDLANPPKHPDLEARLDIAVTSTARVYETNGKDLTTTLNYIENTLRPALTRFGFAEPLADVPDILYDRSLNRSAWNEAYFRFYLHYVEQFPTARRLESLTYSRARTFDSASALILAAAERIVKKHPELSGAIESLRYPNQKPSVPFVTGEWMYELEQLRQTPNENFAAARTRLFQKASTKGSQDYRLTPEFGGYKNGAGGNKEFQTALKAFIEINYVFRRQTVDVDEALRFIRMVADPDRGTQLLMAVKARSHSDDSIKFAAAALEISKHRQQRVRCEVLFR